VLIVGGLLVSNQGDLTIVSLGAQRVVRVAAVTTISDMVPRTLVWRVYVLVGGVVALMVMTVLAALAADPATADVLPVLCGGLAVAIGGVLIVQLERSLGRAVESMRERIQRESRKTEQLARLREADRIAQDLGSTTVHDLFGISLALQSAAARHPSAAPALRAVTADMDRVLREIRSRVFNDFTGDRTVADVLTAIDPELSAPPMVDGTTNVPAPAALEALLRELLPRFPAAPRVLVLVADEQLHVRVTGTPPEDPAAMKELAADHGATASYEPDHMTVDWTGPL
jgi:hypothetical protein